MHSINESQTGAHLEALSRRQAAITHLPEQGQDGLLRRRFLSIPAELERTIELLDDCDVMQVVHGPFQTFYERPIVLLLLVDDDPVTLDLFDRLESILVPRRHFTIRVRAELQGPLRLLDYDAACNQLLLAALDLDPIAATSWPGQGCDGPLYNLEGFQASPHKGDDNDLKNLP